MKLAEPTSVVTAIGNLNITGNVIPANWWRHVLLPSGKPDCTAIVLLSDIVYWYRPTEVRDENTGAITGYRKRFHGDKLQRSYQAFADQFGFSKREATDALKRLRDAGLITLELRTVQTSGGWTASNVLFVEPVAQAIADITTGTPVTNECNTSYVETEQPLRSNVGGVTLKRETYTEITTEIKKITDSSSEPASAGSDQQNQTKGETQTTQACHSLNNQNGQGDNDTTPTAKEHKAAKKPKGTSKTTPCPQQEILALWNEIMPELTQPRIWTDARSASLAARWKNQAIKADSIEFWEKLFRYIRTSDFLMGRTQSPGRRPMALTLDWVCKAENFAKIIEGRYENAG